MLIETRLLRHCKQIPQEIYEQAYKTAIEDKDRPAWCLIPFKTAYDMIKATVSPSIPESQVAVVIAQRAMMLSYCAPWRLTQDIVRIHQDLLAEISETPMTGDIPVDVLLKIPVWCMFVEYSTEDFCGFFFFLDGSPDKTPELRILWMPEHGDNILSTTVSIGKGTVEEALEKSDVRTLKAATQKQQTDLERVDHHNLTQTALNIILYLCAQNAEYDPGSSKPSPAKPVKTKKGVKYLVAPKPRIWKVGTAIGEQIRQAKQASLVAREIKERRPHIRRAHWHGYWTGEGRKNFELRWLAPAFVSGTVSESDRET